MRKLLALPLLAVLLAAGVPSAVASSEAAALPDMDQLDPVRYSYADALKSKHVINGRDSVQRIAFDLIRPNVEPGVKVPTIMVSSPYYNTNGRFSYNAAGTFVAMHKTPWGGPLGGPSGLAQTQFPEQYDEMFVPRGYAVLLHDLRGSRNSSGCQSYGHRSEAEDAVDVINWVAQQGWSNGAVGMIGGSYDGTIANGAASMAPPALKAIVPIRAIDRWYDYHHFNGVLSSNYVTPFTFSVTDPAEDQQNSSITEDQLFGLHVIERKACAVALGPSQGAQYANPIANSKDLFWDARDFVKDASKVTAAVWVVHGLNDDNVKPTNAVNWYQSLPASTPKKLWWLRGAHDNPHNPKLKYPVHTAFELELHRWFAQFLKGLPAGALDTPPVMVQEEKGALAPAPVWPAPFTDRSLYLTGTGLVETKPAPGAVLSYSDLPSGGGTYELQSAPLASDLRISGQPYMDLTYTLGTGGDTTFAYTLQDVSSSGEVTIARGYARGGFRSELKPRGVSYPTIPVPHAPGASSTIQFPFYPTDYVVQAGHRIQLVLAADDGQTQGGGNGTTQIQLGASRLVIPDAASRSSEASKLEA